MKLQIESINSVPQPPIGYGYAFIDAADNKLKVKLHDSIIEYSDKPANVNLLDFCDYTAFEVFAHDYDIPVGDCVELGGNIYSPIGAQSSNFHSMVIRTKCVDNTKCDVVIDWGDGSISSIANGDFITSDRADASASIANGYRNYTVEHVYNLSNYPLSSDQSKHSKKFIVKIFGKNYYAIKQTVSPANKPIYSYSLLSRCLDIDLPIASHLTNLSSMFTESNRLLKVDAKGNFPKNVINASGMFSGCSNLYSVSGLKRVFRLATVESMFSACYNLRSSDVEISDLSPYVNQQRMYDGCKKLEVDVLSLIPPTGIKGDCSLPNVFRNCQLLTCSDYNKLGSLLWLNNLTNWNVTTGCFSNCTSLDLSKIPSSWGGTASDDIIEKSDKEIINELNLRIDSIENQLTGLNTSLSNLANEMEEL